jgi:hypothetical protein
MGTFGRYREFTLTAAVRVRVQPLACHIRHGCIFRTTLHQSRYTRTGGVVVNIKPKRLLLLTIVALALGIGGSKVISVLTPHTQTDIETLVAARMDDSTLPQFSNVRRDEVNEHDWCGEVSGKDSFGVSVDHTGDDGSGSVRRNSCFISSDLKITCLPGAGRVLRA